MNQQVKSLIFFDFYAVKYYSFLLHLSLIAVYYLKLFALNIDQGFTNFLLKSPL